MNSTAAGRPSYNDSLYTLNEILTAEIDKRTDDILEQVEIFGARFKEAAGDPQNKGKIGRTQFGNLLRNARLANSTEEIKMYLEYQRSRSGMKKEWAAMCGGKSITRHLLDSIENIEKMAEEIGGLEALKHMEKRLVKLQVVVRFLGYLFWKGTILSEKD